MMAHIVFALCAITSLACAVLLWRGYRKSGVRLLYWSALCFAGFFLNNMLLIIDVQFIPSVDLAFWRTVPALAGICCLLYGLVLEARE